MCLNAVAAPAAEFSGRIYHLPGPFAPWLWPSLILAGIILQLAALWLKNRWIGAVGLALALAGAIPERDLTLGVGIVLVSIGLWFCAKKN